MQFKNRFVVITFLLLSMGFSKAQKLSGAFQTTQKTDSTIINYISSNEIPLTDAIINYGKLFLDTPYHYGSSGSSSFDCSGFTSYVYRNFGFNLERSSYDQARQFETVDREQLKPGDLVFFSGRRKGERVGHVGIVVNAKKDGNFDFIHASVQRGVTISNSDEDYYRRRFIKANRVIYNNQLLAIAPTVKAINESEKANTIQLSSTTVSKQTKKVIPAEYHRVKSGETLLSIAHKYDLSVAELKRKNNIKGSTINPKQRLKIKNEETMMVLETVQLAENKPVQPSPTTSQQTQVAATPQISISLKQENVVSNASTVSSFITHLVQKGETLFSISSLYHTTIDQLKKLNNIDKNSIVPGQDLKIVQPAESTKPAASAVAEVPVQKATVQPAKVTPSTTVETTVNQTNQPKKEETDKTDTYRVKKGESLYTIANKFNMSIDKLKDINNLTDNTIHFDQTLKITQNSLEKKDIQPVKPETKQKTIQHKVKSGESFYSIAHKYNCSVKELKNWNDKSGNKIKPGDKLTIHTKNT